FILENITSTVVPVLSNSVVQSSIQLGVSNSSNLLPSGTGQLAAQSLSSSRGSGLLGLFGLLGIDSGGVAASQHGDSHDTGQHQGSNFLELHNEFSSLWCIKDRDPKQAERKVLSFQRHYSIPPPGVKARFTIFSFLLSFRYFGWKCEVYVWIVYAVILYIYSFWFAGLGAGAPEGRAYQSERRADGVKKKRCAIHLTRSKELFQPDARSDLLHLGPWLCPGRCEIG